MFARVVKKLFPPDPEEELNGTIVLCSMLDDESKLFSAKGPLLPAYKGAVVQMEGNMTTFKGRDTLDVTSYKVDTPSDRNTTVNFFMSLPRMDRESAYALINSLGVSIFKQLDANPELLFKYLNKGIASTVYEAYCLRRPKNGVLQSLLSYRVSKEKVCSIALAIPSVEQMVSRPFAWAVGTELSFQEACRIAKANKVPKNTLDGVMASIVDVLQQAEGSSSGRAFTDGEATGNTYVTREALLPRAASQVGLLTDDPLIAQGLDQLRQQELIVVDGEFVYRKCTADAEYGICRELLRLRNAPIPQDDYRNDIAALEFEQKMRLAPEQRNAVKVALNNSVTLLIGGPGTGKTTIERVIITLYRKFYPSQKIVLVAPTGKAACRMSESTGEPAFTVHKALGVTAGTEVLKSDVVLDAGLVIVDEASMLGGQESWALFKAIPTGCRVVIVGDTNQLPSVGAGNVLFELIESKCFALAQLITVYRQKAGSTIAVNCARVKLGKADLEYADNFLMKEAGSQDEAVEMILDSIRSELQSGLTLDDICVLSPYRKSTATGTDALNLRIQEEFGDKSQSISYGSKTLYINDKVMYKRNHGGAVNGDIGKIIAIRDDGITVDYGDRKIDYAKSELRDFDLAFSITIHKSQGAEFPTCIVVMMDEHAAMLKRNLIYTALSRAKNKIVLVGTNTAIEKAIATEEVSIRNSRLRQLLKAG